MDLARNGNLIEAGVWFFLGLVLLLHASRSPKRLRSILFVLTTTLILFGVSDLVESRTGAWWTPWWLFVWKAICVIALLLGFLRYYALVRRERQSTAFAPPSRNP
jgi:hypothetical protein